MPTLFLASASPRRAELLGQIAVPFQRVSASIDETPREAEEPAAYVERLALEKAQAGLQQLQPVFRVGRLRRRVHRRCLLAGFAGP